MPVTTGQRVKCRLLLGVTDPDAETTLNTALDALIAEEVTEVEAILAAAADLELQRVQFSSDGITLDQVAQYDALRDRLAITIRVANNYAGYVGTVEPDDEDDCE